MNTKPVWIAISIFGLFLFGSVFLVLPPIPMPAYNAKSQPPICSEPSINLPISPTPTPVPYLNQAQA